jgi:hypothetical protein
MTDEDVGADFAHPARVYDYWLGGTDNFPADRAAAEQVMVFSQASSLTAADGVTVVQADLRDVDGVLSRAGELLDLSQLTGPGPTAGSPPCSGLVHHSEAGRKSQVSSPDTSTGTDTGST